MYYDVKKNGTTCIFIYKYTYRKSLKKYMF